MSLFIGHSFITRLGRYVHHTHGEEPLSVDGYELDFRGYSGATLPKLKQRTRSIEFGKFPIVYIEIGSNDFCTSKLSIESFVNDLLSFAETLIDNEGVQKIVIGELLYRGESCQYPMDFKIDEYNAKISNVNECIKSRCQDNSKIHFHTHRRLHGQRFLAKDRMVFMSLNGPCHVTGVQYGELC
jgi:hypothetical protein